MPGIEIRPLGPPDAPWLAGLIRREMAGEPLVSAHGAHRLPREGAPEGLVAARGKERLGVLWLAASGGEAEIVLMAVDEGHRDQGIGAALLARAIAEARAKGLSRLFLTTTNDNADAMRFYERQGLVHVRTHEGAAARARARKPAIPLMGAGGVPIRDFIEYEIRLAS